MIILGTGYLGCFSDYDRLGPGRDRVLSDGPREYDYILTIDLCIKACKEDGYFYAGVEDEDQCFCGGQDENLVKHGNASDGECKGVCAGDRLESCGYSDFIGIYQVGLGVCEDPGTPQNGFRYNETGSLRYGSKIYFNCSDEFTLEGPDVIQCVQMFGRRDDVSIANSTHAVMWNQSLPKFQLHRLLRLPRAEGKLTKYNSVGKLAQTSRVGQTSDTTGSEQQSGN
ncbi:kremen protein 2 [Strongylocentrotus purpuratus]|uniref:WSC domain-containing protein n=1 Tax=Strongylocentrotus purpuratus TaxID=7668 RepID=A0A7M7NNU6_STRPU|nr:kremen protein 2 [Strongylocentrotus purpuratus]